MKIYIVMNALPWESFTVNLPDPQNEGQVIPVRAESNANRAGFLPVFWSVEEAERTFPGFGIQQAEVDDNWNPWLNAQKEVSAAPAEEVPSEA